MNIFALDDSAARAATFMCDQHLNKMILESAQMLCTVARQQCGVSLKAPFKGLYKGTHDKHPCTVWLSEAGGNCDWLFEHLVAIDTQRFERQCVLSHASVFVAAQAMKALQDGAYLSFLLKPRTPFAQAMPEYCRIQGNPVEAYRQYYKHKDALWQGTTGRKMTWTNVERPVWMD